MRVVFGAVSILRRIRYRSWQYFHGLRPFLTVDEIGEVRRRLRPVEFDLFLAAQPRDRRHSVDLFCLIQREGIAGAAAPDEVLLAALLHDVGKGDVTAFDRVAFVVLNAASERLARWCEREHGTRRQRALWRLRHHAALGAEMLARVGVPARATEIVRRHTEAAPKGSARGDIELAAFIVADGRV